MKLVHLQTMSAEELWLLYNQIRELLAQKTEQELRTLQRRLRKVKPRKPYSKVAPRFQNPQNPTQT
ncbi:hypothetical protein [Bradyrhizobium genosp. P]|uniref:hypothetical protein n=1 Tax=Bradyrhizobium genosp. P TaxID=83641 RepID=UPI003CEEDC22